MHTSLIFFSFFLFFFWEENTPLNIKGQSYVISINDNDMFNGHLHLNLNIITIVKDNP